MIENHENHERFTILLIEISQIIQTKLIYINQNELKKNLISPPQEYPAICKRASNQILCNSSSS